MPQTPADVEFHFHELLSNDLLAVLPLHNTSFSTLFKRVGEGKGALQLGDERITLMDPLTATEPDKTACYVEFAGNLVWGGIVWTREYSSQGHELVLGMEDFGSYLTRRFIQSTQGMLFPAGGVFQFPPKADALETNVAGYPETGDLWDNLNPDVTPGEASYIYNSAAGTAAYLARADIPAGTFDGVTPRSVTLWARCTSNGAGTASMFMRIGGVDYGHFAQNVFPGATISHTWTLNPATGLPWTDSDLEAFASTDSFGVFTTSALSYGGVFVHEIGMDVTWDGSQGGRIEFSQIDQFDIARDLFRHVQSFVGGDLGIILPSEDLKSGRVRQRTYYGFEYKEVWEALVQLSEVIDGFDFSIEVRYGPDRVPEKFLRLEYPYMGRSWRESGLALEVLTGNLNPGSNLETYTWPEDGSRMATHVHAIGAGEGDTMVRATAVNQHLMESEYPMLEETYTYKDVVELSTLEGHAQADAAALQEPFVNPTVHLSMYDQPKFGSYQVGDEAMLHIRDARFPAGIRAPYRVLGITMKPPTREVELELGTMTSLTDKRQNP